MHDYDSEAQRLVQNLHPYCIILGTGGIWDGGDDMPIAAGVSVTIETQRSRAQDVRVYEVIFHPDGDGVYGCVATTYGDAEKDFESFKYDLISGEVKIITEVTPA